MTAPHSLKQFKRDDFLGWLEGRGASLTELTNQYEVVRYRMWTPTDKARPSTHIIYKRENGSLTYTGSARQHYESFCGDKGRGL